MMLCAGTVRVGPMRQCFWAVWDPKERFMRERTRLVKTGAVRIAGARLEVRDEDVMIGLGLDDGPPVEVVSPHGSEYIWTRKRGGVRARGVVALGGEERALDACAVVDESAGYHARATAWEWSAGVGVDTDGRPVAWNLVDGVHDAAERSERTLWVDGEPREVAPVRFAPDLSAITGTDGETLRFEAQSERSRN